MADVRLSDNGDFTVPPHPNMGCPVLATGQTLTDAAINGDHEATVVGGRVYAFTNKPAAVASGTATDNTFIFGLADITTAANVLWVCTPGQTILIQIPIGTTSLHYASLVNGGTGYLRELQ